MKIPKDILELKDRCENAKMEFDFLKNLYRNYLVSLSNSEYSLLKDKIDNVRVTKIMYKLLHFPGDISNAMLVRLSEAFEEAKNK